MPRGPMANARPHGWPQRSRSLSASQCLRKQLQASRHSDSNPLASDLEAVAAELAEVKDAMRHGGTFLGLSGTLLQEYFVELAKKDNLLRLALSRASESTVALSRCESEPVAGQLHRQTSKRRSHTAPLSRRRATSSTICPSAEIQPQPLVQQSVTLPSKCPTVGDTFVTVCDAAAFDAVCDTFAAATFATVCESSTTTASDIDVDCSNLATVLDVLEANPDDARIQRLGIKAIGRLARDATQLRPLCLAATLAVKHCITNFRTNLWLNRLAVTALGNLAYLPEVAALIAHEALPAVFPAMVAHANDEKLQGLACEALARLVQAGELLVVKTIVQTMLSHPDTRAVHVCCTTLVRLHNGGICRSNYILDVLLPLTESQPAQLELQQRAATAMQELVRSGAINEAEAKGRASSLLSPQWVQLLARFAGADRDEDEETKRFHAEVQTVFHEEVVKQFEFEAAEQSLHLLQRRAPGTRRLREVVHCFVQNLEDYRYRLEARELAWDPTRRRLISLDEGVREGLCAEALGSMETGLIDSLQAAASGESPQEVKLLAQRTSRLRNECAALLERKTEATQLHQERTMELRREVMLFEAVEHLELRAPADVSMTQIRSALHMLDTVESTTPPEAVHRLRGRLERLAKGSVCSPPSWPGLLPQPAPAG